MESNQAQASTQPAIRVYRDNSVEVLIDSMDAPLTTEGRKSVEAHVQAFSCCASQAETRRLTSRLDGTRARLKDAECRFARAEKDRDEELARLVEVSRVAVYRGVLAFLAWLTCISAEFYVTLSTLPWFLNLNPTSPVSYALSAIGVATVCALEFAIGLMILPYLLNGQKALESRVRSGFIYAFAVLTVSANLWMVSSLASAREAAAQAMKDAARPKLLIPPASYGSKGLAGSNAAQAVPASSDTQSVDQAILALSIAACIDGGLFSLLFMADFSGLAAGRRQKKFLKELQSRRDRAESDLHSAEQGESEASQDFASRVEHAAQAASEFTTAMLCRLQLRLDSINRRDTEQHALQAKLEEEERLELERQRRIAPKPPLDQLITAVLRHEMDRHADTVQ